MWIYIYNYMSSNSEQSASIVRGGRQERCGESVVLLVVLLVLLTLKLNAPAPWPPAGLRESHESRRH